MGRHTATVNEVEQLNRQVDEAVAARDAAKARLDQARREYGTALSVYTDVALRRDHLLAARQLDERRQQEALERRAREHLVRGSNAVWGGSPFVVAGPGRSA